MRRHSRGFRWATKPPTGVLQLAGGALTPSVCFPLDDQGIEDIGTSNTPIRNLGGLPLGAFATGTSGSTAAVRWQPTRLGLAARLGDPTVATFLDAGSAAVLKPTGAFSLEAWIQNSVWDTNTGIAGSWDGNGYMLYSSGGVARAYINGTNVIGATTLPTDGLVHLVETYDGGTVKLYVDGREDATGAASGLAASAVAWQAGKYAGTGGANWTGDARYLLIALFPRCLGPGEVRQRFVEPFGIFSGPRLHPRGRLGATTIPPFDWYVAPAGPDRTPPAVVGYET